MTRLRQVLARHIQEKYGVELTVVLEGPPKLEMGEAASPVCFELAKRLKKAPRQIAQEIANSLPKIAGIARVELAAGANGREWRVASGEWRAQRSDCRAHQHQSQ